MNHYEVLGIGKDASQEDIKKAYKKKVFELHPDRNQNDPEAEQKLKIVNEAYSVLSDPNQRQQYDNPEQFSEDPFQTHFRDFFSQMFGQPRPTPQTINATVIQTLAEMITGSEREIDMTYTKPCDICVGMGIDSTKPSTTCDKCGGKGHKTVQATPFMHQTFHCEACRGQGKIFPPCGKCNGIGHSKETVKVRAGIPKGIREGVIKISNNELRRHFLVQIKTQIPEEYTLEGEGNLRSTLKVPFTKLCLGGKVTIKDVQGKDITIKIPENTQSGKVIRLVGKGVPKEPNSDQLGNLLLEVHAEIPKTLNQKQETLLKELAKEGL